MNNQDVLITVIAATALLVILLCFIVSFVLLYKHRQNRHQSEMQHVQEQYDQEILKTQLEIKEQTLKMISDELHDNFGQILSLIVLNLSAVEFDDIEDGHKRVENATQLLKKNNQRVAKSFQIA